MIKRFKKWLRECPLGHECNSDCGKHKDCPCDEHEHKKARLGNLLWKINRKWAFRFCRRFEIPF